MRKIDPNKTLTEPSNYSKQMKVVEQYKTGRTTSLNYRQRQRVKAIVKDLDRFAQAFAKVVHAELLQLDDPNEHLPIDEWEHLIGAAMYMLQEMENVISCRMPIPETPKRNS